MAKRLFLIEDDAFVRDLYTTVLSKAGYQVDVAEDGEKAVEMVKNGQVSHDLILLDIMLPKLTGLEVLKFLKQEGSGAKNIPVYLLTNLGEENIVQEAYKTGAEGYLLKAKYLPKELVEEIDKFFVKTKGPEMSEDQGQGQDGENGGLKNDGSEGAGDGGMSEGMPSADGNTSEASDGENSEDTASSS